jgi:hypothetical protein
MHNSEISLGGRMLTLETGKWAKQADGSVIVRMGDTMVLVTACHAGSPREGIDFLPLTVDYRENAYASGRIPGGFFKREGKATEKETLTCEVAHTAIKDICMRDEILERGRLRRLDGRRFDEGRSSRPIWAEVACLPRVTARPSVHARRDPGAGHRHARHLRRPAEGRDGRRRDLQALHAPLQLPAVLGRRSASSCAAPAGARSATARSPNVRSRR